MYPSSLRSTAWGKHSEGFIPFSPSLQVLLVPIYCQSSIAAQKKLQHRWPQVLLKASVGTARAESSRKWSSKRHKTARAATFTSFSSSLPLCKRQTCLTWLTKQSIWTHLTASPVRRMCICWSRHSQWCRDWLHHDPEVRAARVKTQLALWGVIL